MSDYRNLTLDLENFGLDYQNRQVDGKKFLDAQWIDPDAPYPSLIGSLDVTNSKAGSAAAWRDLFPPLNTNKPLVGAASGTVLELTPLGATANYDTTAAVQALSTSSYYSTPNNTKVALVASDFTLAGSTGPINCIDAAMSGATRTAVEWWPRFTAGVAAPTPPTLQNVRYSGAAGFLNNSTAGMPGYEWRATLYDSIRGRETPLCKIAGTARTPWNSSAGTSVAIDLVFTALPAAAVGWGTPADALAAGYDKLRLYRKGGAVIDGFRLTQESNNPGGAGATITFTDGGGGPNAGLTDMALSIAPKLNEDLYFAFNPYYSVVSGVYSTANVPRDAANELWITTYGLVNYINRIFGTFQGDVTFGWSASQNPQRINWTQPGKPGLWNPTANYINVCGPDEAIQAGLVYNGVPYVFTESNCYALDFGGIDAFPMFKPRVTSIGIGVLGPKAAVSLGPTGVILINESGIYITDCESQIEKISDEGIGNFFSVGSKPPVGVDNSDTTSLLYDPSQKAESVAFSRGKLYIVLPIKRTAFIAPSTWGTQTRRYAFVYSPVRKAWSNLKLANDSYEITAFLSDNSGTEEYLWCLTNGNNATVPTWGALGVIRPISTLTGTASSSVPLRKIVDKTGATATLDPYISVTTSELSAGIPTTFKEWGSVLVDLDVNPYGNGTAPVVSVTPFGGSTYTNAFGVISAAGRQRTTHACATSFAESTNYTISVTNQRATLFNITILYREDEEKMSLWEVPFTANAQMGWHMFKGAYITLRSDATVTLTVGTDALTPVAYTIASTGGVKQKVYVPFVPRKGKAWSFKFAAASTGYFRIYGEDSEFLVKTWGSRGWQSVNPLTASGYASFLRQGGGT